MKRTALAFSFLCSLSLIGCAAEGGDPGDSECDGDKCDDLDKPDSAIPDSPCDGIMVDKSGRYSLQIFRPGRPKFASGVKAQGTPQEYRDAVLGSSTHTGRASIDAAHHKLVFKIESSSYPNWEGSEQTREYTFKDGTLTYSVPASASGNGTIAYSVWTRAQP